MIQSILSKDHERQHRTNAASVDHHLAFNSPLPGLDMITKHKTNKQRLSNLLCTHNMGESTLLVGEHEGIITHKKADVNIVSHTLKAAVVDTMTIQILSNDMDIFVLCVYWCWKANVEADSQMKLWDGKHLAISKMVSAASRDACYHRLGQCRYLRGKRKMKTLKLLQTLKLLHSKNFPELDTTLSDKNATLDDLMSIGVSFFRALPWPSFHNQLMNQVRYQLYVRSKKPPIESLPLTDTNLASICSVHITLFWYSMWRLAATVLRGKLAASRAAAAIQIGLSYTSYCQWEGGGGGREKCQQPKNLAKSFKWG